MSNRAWVTLVTNDSYGLGALVLAHSIVRAGSTYPSVVLVTPNVTDPMRDRLREVFADVITVDVLDSRDAAHLALLQRPELGITFTKIHCWSLTQYEKCVFLDADTLVLQNCDELFEREELSAAPDVGWPDCFNSGVFVFRPSQETFDALIKFAQERGSFDGGDQGLLNSFFSDWAHGDINKHLPFLYNVTSAAFYSYLPAFKQFGENMKIIHFIGPAKPWLQQYNWDTNTVDAPDHIKTSLQQWWEIFRSSVHRQLDSAMTGVAGNLARVVPGTGSGSTTEQRVAVDELSRRQGWETGNIDYMGADSFDNIWAKISNTLNEPKSESQTEVSSPPVRESLPPTDQIDSPSTTLEKKIESSEDVPLQKQDSLKLDIKVESQATETLQEIPSSIQILVTQLPSESSTISAAPLEIKTPAMQITTEQEIALKSNVEEQVEESPSVEETAPSKDTVESVSQVSTELAPTTEQESVTVSSNLETTEQSQVSVAEVPSVTLSDPVIPNSVKTINETLEAELEQVAELIEGIKLELSTTKTPPSTPKTTPDPEVANPPSKEDSVVVAEDVVASIVTPDKSSDPVSSPDSPPLATTPAKEGTPPSNSKCPNRPCSIM